MKFFNLFVLIFLPLAGMIASSLAESYDCTIEKEDGMEMCVFRNVRYFKNTTQIAFYSPGPSKPENVAFVDSQMVAVPPNFLTAFGNNLKVLKIENSELQTVSITRSMEALHARNNYIKKVLMHQNHNCDNLRMLDLSSNHLEDVGNITNCAKLETLNLSGNEKLWKDSTLDLSVLDRLDQLQTLNVSRTGVLYVENSKDMGLPNLHTMDLSKNDILPVDFNIEIFFKFTSLKTLWLNDNGMTSIDYAYFTKIDTLSTVYLNGNSFQCMKIKEMLDFLNSRKIITPTDRHSNCQQNAREVEGMCCIGPLPTNRPHPQPTTAGEQGVNDGDVKATTKKPTENGLHGGNGGSNADGGNGGANENEGETKGNEDNGGNGGSSLHWIIGAVVGIALAVTAVVGIFLYRKRHN